MRNQKKDEDRNELHLVFLIFQDNLIWLLFIIVTRFSFNTNVLSYSFFCQEFFIY